MNQIEEVKRLVCAPKYLEKGESFKQGMARIAHHLSDNTEHFNHTKEMLEEQRFLPAGRVQASAGATRVTTAFNCFVSPTILDSMDGIMEALAKAAQTMRLGGGDGFDFSTIRPSGALIKSLGSTSSGPISFMGMWDAMCATIKSAGHRRGAMMGVMRIDHPDVEEFITAKQDNGKLTNFNISVAITDKFMEALRNDDNFDLVFPVGSDNVYKTVKARALWDKIMRNTWSYAEPGVLFIDTINKKNNLYYCETIAATNPCGEQPLPPNGACLLGSINLVKYCKLTPPDLFSPTPYLDYDKIKEDIPHIIRMMDNIVDRTVYPLKEQEVEAKNKRRMGIGITGLANTLSFFGIRYGSPESISFTSSLMEVIRDECYRASIELAKEKGPFPLFDADKYLGSPDSFIQTLPDDIKGDVKEFGIRNSHLLSIAPTGTISLWAGNVSSGIEPVFSHEQERTVYMPDGNGAQQTFVIQDYAYSEWGIKGELSDEIGAKAHIDMLTTVSRYVDSACSKTCNVGDEVPFDDFKDLYLRAYEGGASGCTTFNVSRLTKSVLKKVETVKDKEGAACYIDPETGERSCSD
ncbi:MAG: ribonucleoside-diphosphate reductase, adenosylcobalamin-dependent [Sandaracinus sp.]|nr:ribonucleoside-diphosphate reductase, adenosylcobalamin-dependent [Sandaracinus sp.]